jgi:Ca-activated chloride channel family protein
VIYCVGLLFGEDTDKRESRHARRVLETLAEQTGGAAYFPKSVNQVDEIAAEVAQDIRTQYTISYHSTKSPLLGGYREIHVEAKGKSFGRLSVRTRTGYYPKVATSNSTDGAPALNNAGSKQANKKRD